MIHEMYIEEKMKNPEKFKRRIDLSWSIWMFGKEPLEKSLKRLKKNNLNYVELKGDYTPDKENEIEKKKKLLEKYEIKLSGVCGLYSLNEDLASVDKDIRDSALNYIKNQIDFISELNGKYLIVVPSAVGRLNRFDENDLERSAEALSTINDYFIEKGVKAAIEPIRSAEVYLVNKIDQVLDYLKIINKKGIDSINGDIYHMINGEKHIGEAILKCGSKLVNLHLADSNRDGLGRGVIDIDTVIKASYLVGMNEKGRFLTFEPLGPFPDPYVLSNSIPDEAVMDDLVKESVNYFREREEIVREL